MAALSPGDLSPLQSPEVKRGSVTSSGSPRNKRRRCDASPLSVCTRPTTAESTDTDLAAAAAAAAVLAESMPQQQQQQQPTLLPLQPQQQQQQQSFLFPPWSLQQPPPPPPPQAAPHNNLNNNHPWFEPFTPQQQQQQQQQPPPSRTLFLQQQQQRKHQRTREALQQQQHHHMMLPLARQQQLQRKGRHASQGTYAQQARAACRISSTGPMLPANGPIVARCVQPRSEAERHAKFMRQQQRAWNSAAAAGVQQTMDDEDMVMRGGGCFGCVWPPQPNSEPTAPADGTGYYETALPSSVRYFGNVDCGSLSAGMPPAAASSVAAAAAAGEGEADGGRLPRCANARAAISAYPYPPAPPHRLPKLKHTRQQYLFQEYLKVVQDPMRIQLGHFLIEHCIRSVPDDCLKPDSQPDPSIIVEFADQIIAAVQIFGHETRFGTAQDAIPSDINEAYIYNWIHQNRALLQPLETMLERYRCSRGYEAASPAAGGDVRLPLRDHAHHEDKGSGGVSRRCRRAAGIDSMDCLEKQAVPGAIHCDNLPSVIAHAGLLVRLPHQSYAICHGGCARCSSNRDHRRQQQQHLLFNLLIAGRGDTRRCRMQMPWGETVYIKYNRTLLGIPDFVVSCLGFGTGASGGTHLIPKVCAVSLEEVPAGVEILLFYRGLPCVKRKLQSVPRYMPPYAATCDQDWQQQLQQQHHRLENSNTGPSSSNHNHVTSNINTDNPFHRPHHDHHLHQQQQQQQNQQPHQNCQNHQHNEVGASTCQPHDLQCATTAQAAAVAETTTTTPFPQMLLPSLPPPPPPSSSSPSTSSSSLCAEQRHQQPQLRHSAPSLDNTIAALPPLDAALRAPSFGNSFPAAAGAEDGDDWWPLPEGGVTTATTTCAGEEEEISSCSSSNRDAHANRLPPPPSPEMVEQDVSLLPLCDLPRNPTCNGSTSSSAMNCCCSGGGADPRHEMLLLRLAEEAQSHHQAPPPREQQQPASPPGDDALASPRTPVLDDRSCTLYPAVNSPNSLGLVYVPASASPATPVRSAAASVNMQQQMEEEEEEATHMQQQPQSIKIDPPPDAAVRGGWDAAAATTTAAVHVPPP